MTPLNERGFDPGLDCCPGLVIVRHDLLELKVSVPNALTEHARRYDRLEAKVDHVAEIVSQLAADQQSRTQQTEALMTKVDTAATKLNGDAGPRLTLWQSFGLGLMGFLIAAVGRDVVLWLWHLIVTNSQQ